MVDVKDGEEFSSISMVLIRGNVAPSSGTFYLIGGKRGKDDRPKFSRLQNGFLRWIANATVDMSRDLQAAWDAPRDAVRASRALATGVLLDKVLLCRLAVLSATLQSQATKKAADFSKCSVIKAQATPSAIDSRVSDCFKDLDKTSQDVGKTALGKPPDRATLDLMLEWGSDDVKTFARAAIAERQALPVRTDVKFPGPPPVDKKRKAGELGREGASGEGGSAASGGSGGAESKPDALAAMMASRAPTVASAAASAAAAAAEADERVRRVKARIGADTVTKSTREAEHLAAAQSQANSGGLVGTLKAVSSAVGAAVGSALGLKK